MIVFKGYIKMTKKNIGIVLMYFGIFLGIAIAINATFQKENKEGFAAQKLDVAVVDLDESEMSKQLVSYLKQKHQVTLQKDDKAKLAEELYYQKHNVVLRILEGFEEKAEKGEIGINLTNSPGSYNGIYLEQQINNFMRNIFMYRAAGYSTEEGCQKAMQQKESNVTLEDLNGNGGKLPAHGSFFQYLPYLFLAVFGAVLGKILFTFRRREVKNRLMASAVPLIRQNAETILAFFVIGMMMYTVCIVSMMLLYGDSVRSAGNLIWYFVNGFLCMLSSLEVAFIIGVMVKSEMQINTVSTPVSLGICFLCGVFVPLNVMGAQTKAVAKFLPIYWYESVNNLLMKYEDVSGAIGKQVLVVLGIQVLFVFALASAGMAIVRYQQQER